MKTVSTQFSRLGLAVVGSFALVACVDARSAYDDYSERAGEDSTVDVDGQLVTSLPDVNGDNWFLAVRPDPAVIAEDRVILFRATFELTPITENTGRLDISAQPLEVADEHAPVGEPFVASNRMVAADATYDAPFNGTIEGEANPITGGDADIDAEMQGELRSTEFVCGTLTGQAGALPLAGTKWAAVRITGDTLPTPIFRCEDQPAE